MDDLTRQSVDEFLNAVAERSPTPGGGSAAAAAGALACALGRMTANYSINKNTEPSVRDRVEAVINRLRSADEILRGLVTQDAAAYAHMSAAAKAKRENPVAASAYQKAVLSAVAVPLEAAAAISHALAAMDELKDFANRNLLSDLGVAAVLAEAAAQAAWYMVAVNLPELTDSSAQTRSRRDIVETVKHCDGYRRSIEAFLRSHLDKT